jgi:hypothetical protein
MLQLGLAELFVVVERLPDESNALLGFLRLLLKVAAVGLSCASWAY